MLIPPIGLVIGTFASPGFVALQLESARRFAPGMPVLIHDDCSPNTQLASLANRYGAELVSTTESRGHYEGDMAAVVNGLIWARTEGLPYLVKLSRRFIPIVPWVPEFLSLAAKNPPTIGASDLAFGWSLRTEFVGFHVDSWLPLLDDLKAYRGNNGHVEDVMASHAARLGPVALFDFLGVSRVVNNDNFLWHSFTDEEQYAAQAMHWGLPLASSEFLREAPNP